MQSRIIFTCKQQVAGLSKAAHLLKIQHSSSLLLKPVVTLCLLLFCYSHQVLAQAQPGWNITILDSVFGAIGNEDVTIHPVTGFAFICSEERRGNEDSVLKIQGGIYGYGLMDHKPALHLLHGNLHFDFHPHGISLYINKATGREFLFAINHGYVKGKKHNSIELFEWVDRKLVWIRSFADSLSMISPNDVLGMYVDPDQNKFQFYFTNDHGARAFGSQMIENMFRVAKSNVYFYNGEKYVRVADKIEYANGINLSKNEQFVYVASVMDGKIFEYKRDFETGGLTLTRTFWYKRKTNFRAGFDNIEIDSEGNLWVGAHTNLFKFIKHAGNEKNKSPFAIFRINPNLDKPVVEEVYRNDGTLISGVSVAAVFKDKMIMGSVFEKHFIVAKFEKKQN